MELNLSLMYRLKRKWIYLKGYVHSTVRAATDWKTALMVIERDDPKRAHVLKTFCRDGQPGFRSWRGYVIEEQLDSPNAYFPSPFWRKAAKAVRFILWVAGR